MMKFTKIRRLISDANDCSNIQLEGEIEEGETLEDADFILRTRLSSMIRDDNERRFLCSETNQLNRQKKELTHDCDKLRDAIKERREFLEKNGVQVDEFLYSDIPF